MSGLHGHWLKIAVAIDNNHRTYRQLVDALQDGVHSSSYIRRGINYGVLQMREHGLLDQDDHGYFSLTPKGVDRMHAGMADA